LLTHLLRSRKRKRRENRCCQGPAQKVQATQGKSLKREEIATKISKREKNSETKKEDAENFLILSFKNRILLILTQFIKK